MRHRARPVARALVIERAQDVRYHPHPVTKDAATPAELVRRAWAVPLARPAVEAFARELPAGSLDPAIDDAIDRAALHAAQVIALAAVAAGRTLSRATVERLLPELDLHEFLPSIARTAGDETSALLAELANAGTLGLEATLLAIYVAAECLNGKPAPRALVTALRTMLRRELYLDERELLLDAIHLVRDDGLFKLVPEARAAGKDADRRRELYLGDPLDCLPDEAALSTISGYTYRKLEAEPGRNDPCPCGSGQKYKKCHGRAGAEALTAPPSVTGFSEALLAPGAARRLPADQFSRFRPAELTRFDPAELTEIQLVTAFDRLLGFRRWPAIERILDEMARRGETIANTPVVNFARDLAVVLVRAGEIDRAERWLERAGDAGGEIALQVALARGQPDAITQLEQAAREGLLGAADRAYDAAFSLLEHSPALGILVARGSLAPGRDRDNESLLMEVETARDRLGVALEEPYWDALDALWSDLEVDESDTHARHRRGRGGGDDESSEEVERLREEMAEARARAHEAERELRERERTMGELQDRHRELEALVARTGAEDHARRVEDLETERARMRHRIEELKANLKEGAEQRRELRERLTERSERGERVRPPAPEGTTRDGDVPRQVDADEEGDAVVERKRPLRVPVFPDGLKKCLDDLPAEVAAATVMCAAALASGAEPTWHEVKRLKRAPDAFSARVGIHHRLLFRARPETIEVIDVVHRRDLARAIDRLM